MSYTHLYDDTGPFEINEFAEILKRVGKAEKKKMTKTKAVTRKTRKTKAVTRKTSNAVSDMKLNVTIDEAMLNRIVDDAVKKLTADMELKQEDKFIWMDQNGTEWKLPEMEESHLRNCVSYTQRRLRNALDNSVYLQRTKDMARAYWEFLRECENRGLDV